MDSTGRSKSFKALSMAKPIKKQIDTTLQKLEAEKRKFLAVERQENQLKEELKTKRKQLNSYKKFQPVTELNDKKSYQTQIKTKNADRTYQRTINNIQELKSFIDIRRRQVGKYKKLNQKFAEDIEEWNKNVENVLDQIDSKQSEIETTKKQILNYREINMSNLQEFRKSHMHLSRSNFDEENQRKKFGVSTKNFLGQQMKNSKIVQYDLVSEQLRRSGLLTNEGKVDMMTESVPFAKLRVNALIHKNKEKIRIAEEYKRFGEGLDNLFKVMRQYKGRDDVDFLADQFVAKERQIQKLGEYIGKLEDRIVSFENQLENRKDKDQKLKEQLTAETYSQSEKEYEELSVHVRQDLGDLKKDHVEMNEWLLKVGQILCPIVNDDDFSRGNSSNVMGKIEQKLGIRKDGKYKNDKSQSPSKQEHKIAIESEEHNQKYNELLNYENMKEYAKTYIKSKRS